MSTPCPTIETMPDGSLVLELSAGRACAVHPRSTAALVGFYLSLGHSASRWLADLFRTVETIVAQAVWIRLPVLSQPSGDFEPRSEFARQLTLGDALQIVGAARALLVGGTASDNLNFLTAALGSNFILSAWQNRPLLSLIAEAAAQENQIPLC